MIADLKPYAEYKDSGQPGLGLFARNEKISFRQCAEAGLRPPTFRQEVGCFIQTLWRPAIPVTGEVTPEVTQEVGDQVGTKLEPSRHQVDVLRKCMEESGIKSFCGSPPSKLVLN